MRYEIRDFEMDIMLTAIKRVIDHKNEVHKDYVRLSGEAIGTLMFIQDILNGSMDNYAAE